MDLISSQEGHKGPKFESQSINIGFYDSKPYKDLENPTVGTIGTPQVFNLWKKARSGGVKYNFQVRMLPNK